VIRLFRRAVVAALAVLPGLASIPAAAATIEVRPQGDYVAKGNLVNIDVIARLDAGERIASYGMAVIWQPAWLAFQSLTIDQFLGGPDNSTQVSAFGLSSVIVSETALAGTDAQSGLSEFRLFRFSLLVTALGVSPLEVGSAQLFDPSGAALPVVIINSSLTTVPVPAAAVLLASALAVAGGGMRRRVG
jgi:hypothetical protein